MVAAPRVTSSDCPAMSFAAACTKLTAPAALDVRARDPGLRKPGAFGESLHETMGITHSSAAVMRMPREGPTLFIFILAGRGFDYAD